MSNLKTNKYNSCSTSQFSCDWCSGWTVDLLTISQQIWSRWLEQKQYVSQLHGGDIINKIFRKIVCIHMSEDWNLITIMKSQTWGSFVAIDFKILKVVQKLRSGHKIYRSVIATLTLNQSDCNMRSAHRSRMVNFCGDFFQNPSRGSKVMERTQFVTDIQPEQKQYVPPLYWGDIINQVFRNTHV